MEQKEGEFYNYQIKKQNLKHNLLQINTNSIKIRISRKLLKK